MRFTIHEISKKESREPVLPQDIKKAFPKKRDKHESNGILYVLEVHQDNEYCFIEIKHGQTDAIECYDTKQESFTNKVLSNSLVHTDEQFFICIKYSADDSFLYISDWNKKHVFLSYCAQHGLELKLRDMLSDIEEFSRKVKKLNKISFRVTNGMYINDFFNPRWFDNWSDISPKGFDINLAYSCKITNSWLQNAYKKLKGEIFIDNLCFEGTDEEERLLSFNTSVLVSKINIEAEKKNGYYNPEEIKIKLLEQIK